MPKKIRITINSEGLVMDVKLDGKDFEGELEVRDYNCKELDIELLEKDGQRDSYWLQPN